MPDPFETLKSSEPIAPSVPPSEVRRRGDRLRRRRTTLQVAGSVLAVVAIVGGIGTARLVGPEAPPALDPSPSTPSPTAIPSDYPLTEGWPDPAEPGGVQGQGTAADPLSWQACGKTFGTVDENTERLTATYQDAQDERSREVRSYGNAARARAAMEEIVSGFESCKVDASGEGVDRIRTRVTMFDPSDIGGENGGGFQVQRMWGERGAPANGVWALNVVMQGQGLLFSETSSEDSGFASADAHARDDFTRLQAAIDAMCLFTRNGCDKNPGPPEGFTTASLLNARELGSAFVDEESWHDRPGRSPSWIQLERENSQPDCRSDLDSNVAPIGMLSREWSGGRNDEAATHLLQFADRGDADRAFEALSADDVACVDTAAGQEVRRPIGDRQELALDDGGTASWQSYIASAPEVCLECDTGWFITYGVVQLDTTLVTITTAHRGDLNRFNEVEAPWMRQLVQRAFLAVGRI